MPASGSSPAKAAADAPSASRLLRSIGAASRRWLRSEYLVLGLCAVMLAAVAPFVPAMLNPANLLGVLAHLIPLMVVALGAMLVLITRGIDLACTSVIALASVIGAQLMTADGGWLAGSPWAVPAGILAMLLIGIAVGALNGAIVAWLRLPAFIVTLAAMMFWSGFAIWFTQSASITGLPATFCAPGQRLALSGPLALALAVLLHLALTRTLGGRWLYAVGRNPVAAHLAGVPVQRVILVTYALAGMLAALASVLLTGRLETGSPVQGREILLDVIGATVVGGTSLFGGRGKVAWTFGGVLLLSLVDNALNLLSLSHFTITMVKGAVILLASVLDALRRRGGANAS